MEWQRDLAISHDWIGDLHLRQGRSSDALSCYQSALKIREKLAEKDEEVLEWQRSLILSCSHIADASASDARTALLRATSIASRLRDKGNLCPQDTRIADQVERSLGALPT